MAKNKFCENLFYVLIAKITKIVSFTKSLKSEFCKKLFYALIAINRRSVSFPLLSLVAPFSTEEMIQKLYDKNQCCIGKLY